MKRMPPILLVTFALLVGCGSPSNSITTDLDDSWSTLFPNESLSVLALNGVIPSTEETNLGITAIYEIKRDDNFLGYAFQATVDGDAGRDTVTFRLTIYDSQYQGFQVLAHFEHTAFGVKQFNALRDNLPGTNVEFAQVIAILNNANAGRSGISETYDGIMPAIEIMTQRYLEV
jgi:hypothetical protein